jgi:hypothetical protein
MLTSQDPQPYGSGAGAHQRDGGYGRPQGVPPDLELHIRELEKPATSEGLKRPHDSQIEQAMPSWHVDCSRYNTDVQSQQIDPSAKASEVARNVAGVRSVKNDLIYATRSSLK